MKRLSLLVILIALIGFNAMAQLGTHSTKGISPSVSTSKKLPFERVSQIRDDTAVWQNFLPCDTFIWDGPLVFNGTNINAGYITGHNADIDSAQAENFQGITGSKIV